MVNKNTYSATKYITNIVKPTLVNLRKASILDVFGLGRISKSIAALPEIDKELTTLYNKAELTKKDYERLKRTIQNLLPRAKKRLSKYRKSVAINTGVGLVGGSIPVIIAKLLENKNRDQNYYYYY